MVGARLGFISAHSRGALYAILLIQRARSLFPPRRAYTLIRSLSPFPARETETSNPDTSRETIHTCGYSASADERHARIRKLPDTLWILPKQPLVARSDFFSPQRIFLAILFFILFYFLFSFFQEAMESSIFGGTLNGIVETD